MISLTCDYHLGAPDDATIESTMQQKFYHPGRMCLLAKKRKGLKSFLAESREKN